MSLKVSAPHEVENIPRNINPIAPENDVTYIRIDNYDDDEMMAAIRTVHGLDIEVAQRIEASLGGANLSAVASRDTYANVPNEVTELIRHPVLWYVFSQLTGEQQRQCLVGDQQALYHLGSDYLKWFRKKAARRITGLQLGQCSEALCEAAKTFSDANDVGCLNVNWLKPAADSIGNRCRAQLLYDEAISAGLILGIDQRQKTWRWRHPWFCNFLVENEGALQ